jgi:hypothetical protein
MDADGALDVRAGCVRRSRVVRAPRCWRYVGGKRSADNGGKRAVLREEHEVSRKAIAQGRPECSRCPVCSCAVLFAQIARETAGAASTRSSLRPLISKRANEDANLGRQASRDREYLSSFRGARSASPESIEQQGNGEMDSGPAPKRAHPGMTGGADTTAFLNGYCATKRSLQTRQPPPARASGTAANPAVARARASSPSLFPARRYPSPPRARRVRPAPAVAAWRW